MSYEDVCAIAWTRREGESRSTATVQLFDGRRSELLWWLCASLSVDLFCRSWTWFVVGANPPGSPAPHHAPSRRIGLLSPLHLHFLSHKLHSSQPHLSGCSRSLSVAFLVPSRTHSPRPFPRHSSLSLPHLLPSLAAAHLLLSGCAVLLHAVALIWAPAALLSPPADRTRVVRLSLPLLPEQNCTGHRARLDTTTLSLTRRIICIRYTTKHHHNTGHRHE